MDVAVRVVGFVIVSTLLVSAGASNAVESAIAAATTSVD
jgi:hypothetical protein